MGRGRSAPVCGVAQPEVHPSTEAVARSDHLVTRRERVRGRSARLPRVARVHAPGRISPHPARRGVNRLARYTRGMAEPRVSAAGGPAAIAYVMRKGREVGYLRLLQRLRLQNACKTCALGMGGQRGGMVNEAGHFPEVCKKSIQAQASDMARAIPEAYFRRKAIADLERMSSLQLDRLGRLAFPLLAGPTDTHFRRTSWDKALDLIAARLGPAPPSEVFYYASGRSSNEAAFLLQLVARAAGTGNVHNCSFYCHQASGIALTEVYGSGTSSVTYDDLGETDLVVLAGANPASNHPRLITELMKLRRRGGKVIVINPMRELGLTRFRVPSDPLSMALGSEIASTYIQPHAGSDAALFLGLLKAVIEAGALDQPFIDTHTHGWTNVRSRAEVTTWDEIVAACGVSRDQIEAVGRALGSAKRGIFLWAMGLTHHQNGVENIEALANLALARGWLGRPGCGLLPIRGHSNVQGVGSMGVSPTLRHAFARALEKRYGIAPAAEHGQHTYASMEAAAAGRVQAAILLGGNLFASNPDREWAAGALRNIPFTVTISTKLNEGHVHGRGQTALILPALARDEEYEPTSQESMFNYVRLSEGGTPSIAGEMRSEVDIIASIAERILPAGRFDWSALRSHRQLREGIAAVVPGYEALGEIDVSREEFQVGGRSFHTPRFATLDGRAQFRLTGLPSFHVAPDEFRLMTIRSEGQFNTVVYEEADLYRGNDRRDVVMLAASDASALGVSEGDPVVVESAAGSLSVVVAIVGVRAGNVAMYYPEANVLVPRILDERSHTPAFKSVAVRIRRVP